MVLKDCIMLKEEGWLCGRQWKITEPFLILFDAYIVARAQAPTIHPHIVQCYAMQYQIIFKLMINIYKSVLLYRKHIWIIVQAWGMGIMNSGPSARPKAIVRGGPLISITGFIFFLLWYFASLLRFLKLTIFFYFCLFYVRSPFRYSVFSDPSFLVVTLYLFIIVFYFIYFDSWLLYIYIYSYSPTSRRTPSYAMQPHCITSHSFCVAVKIRFDSQLFSFCLKLSK